MDKEKNIQVEIEELLPRFCEGLTTEEESRRVESWILEDREHERIVNQIHALLLASDTLDVKNHTDVDKVLNKVRRRMSVRRVNWWEWTQRIAAMLSIPLLMGVLYLSFPKEVQPLVVETIEVRTNPGMTTSVILPDSTLVCLNSESVLRYPTRFEGDTRPVELVGEAFFEVSKDAKKRFIVSAPDNTKVEVYGTSFNVEAYPDADKISTTLIEGKVGFFVKDKEGKNRKVDLQPNQKLVYAPESGEMKVYATSGEVETSWKEGKIIFDNTPMDEVLRMLGKRFNVEFVVKSKHLKDYAFTGTFTTQRLERIMEYFKISSKVRWRYVDSGDMEDKKQKIEIY